MSSPGAKRRLIARARIFYCILAAELLCLALPLTRFYPAAHSQHKGFVLAQESDYFAPFVPSPQEVIDRMLELAGVQNGDVLYDLGSGDGRIVITAAKRYGVKAVGFEINPVLVEEARANIRAADLGHLAEVYEQDVRYVDLAPATVLTLYLYPAANLRLRAAILRQLKPGSRVVSHNFSMGDWKPERIERFLDGTGIVRTIYLWRIPK